MSTKYKDEGVLFWTFFQYLDNCFVENGPQVNSLAECFDWSTVMINGVEEVSTISDCVDRSFTRNGVLDSDNLILKSDKDWSDQLGLKFHPSIVINDVVYKGNIDGSELAFGICSAFKEAPDECDLSWKIKAFNQGVLTDFQDLKMPDQEDYIVEASRDGVTLTHRQRRVLMYVALVGILVVNFAVLYCVRRKMKR